MARITVEDCLKRVPNRFVIVNLAARRVRQIREGSEYLVSSPKNEDIVVALREIAAGKVTPKKGTDGKAEAKPAKKSVEAKAATKAPEETANAAGDVKEETDATVDAATATEEAPVEKTEDKSASEEAAAEESD